MSQKEPQLDIKNLHIRQHGIERAIERFKCKNKVEALNMCKNLLGRAKYIGKVTDIEGEQSIMYAAEKNAIFLTLDLKCIKSIIDYDTQGHYHGLAKPIINLYKTEFRKLSRLEEAKKKKLEFERVNCAAEKANLRLRAYKTRSQNVKQYCAKSEKLIDKKLAKIEDELARVEANKRELVRAMTTVVFPA